MNASSHGGRVLLPPEALQPPRLRFSPFPKDAVVLYEAIIIYIPHRGLEEVEFLARRHEGGGG